MFRGLPKEVGAEPHFGLVHPLREADADITEPLMSSAAYVRQSSLILTGDLLLSLCLDLVTDRFR